MKNYFTTLSILILCSSVVCAYSSFSYPNKTNFYTPVGNNPYMYRINPFAPDPFSNVRKESKFQQKLKLLRQILRSKNSYYQNNLLSWSPFVRSNPNQGSLTGYSVPVNQDIYQGLGINSAKNQRQKSPC